VSSLRLADVSARPRRHVPKHAKQTSVGEFVSDLGVPVAVGGVLTAGFVVASAGAASAAATDEQLAALRQCESGGNYAINTGNGYYGAYQFSASTWRGLGYSGLPHQASPAVQDEATRALQTRSGWGQWPACTRKLGFTGGGGGVPSTPSADAARASRTRTLVAQSATRVVALPAYQVPKTAPLFDAALVITPTPVGAEHVFSPEVKAWQARMQQRGWRITPDGYYGPKSASVAQRFAAEKGLVNQPAGALDKVVFDGAWSIPVT
jgi:hypothetical protein